MSDETVLDRPCPKCGVIVQGVISGDSAVCLLPCGCDMKQALSGCNSGNTTSRNVREAQKAVNDLKERNMSEHDEVVRTLFVGGLLDGQWLRVESGMRNYSEYVSCDAFDTYCRVTSEQGGTTFFMHEDLTLKEARAKADGYTKKDARRKAEDQMAWPRCPKCGAAVTRRQVMLDMVGDSGSFATLGPCGCQLTESEYHAYEASEEPVLTGGDTLEAWEVKELLDGHGKELPHAAAHRDHIAGKNNAISERLTKMEDKHADHDAWITRLSVIADEMHQNKNERLDEITSDYAKLNEYVELVAETCDRRYVKSEAKHEENADSIARALVKMGGMDRNLSDRINKLENACLNYDGRLLDMEHWIKTHGEPIGGANVSLAVDSRGSIDATSDGGVER